MWVITKDNISDPWDEENRVGTRAEQQSTIYAMQRVMGWPAFELPTADSKIAFRLRDEDYEVHYEGVCDDDLGCENQSDLSNFGAADTGAFICEVWRDGKWVIEVG